MKFSDIITPIEIELSEAQVNDFGKLDNKKFEEMYQANKDRVGQTLLDDGKPVKGSLILSIDSDQFTVYYGSIRLLGVTHKQKGQQSLLFRTDELKLLKKAI